MRTGERRRCLLGRIPPARGSRTGRTQTGDYRTGASGIFQAANRACIPLTTQVDALRFPGSVLVEAEADNRLRRASVALVFQLTALDRRFIGTRLGAVSSAVMDLIWNSFDEITERRGVPPNT